jgi:predicted NBD/HSP70 family sugar kinase
MAIRPNIMPGWDGFPISHTIERRFGAPAILENDVNLRAIGEAAALPDDQRPLLVVKVGTGVGAGIVDTAGTVLHGYDGAAGDIGHAPVRGAPVRPCTCGNSGCVEAVVSVPSIVRELRELHPGLLDDDGNELDQLISLLARSHPAAVSIVRASAVILGEVVAMLCNTLNPRRVVVGGDLTSATDEILAGVRTVAYQRARRLQHGTSSSLTRASVSSQGWPARSCWAARMRSPRTGCGDWLSEVTLESDEIRRLKAENPNRGRVQPRARAADPDGAVGAQGRRRLTTPRVRRR